MYHANLMELMHTINLGLLKKKNLNLHRRVLVNYNGLEFLIF